VTKTVHECTTDVSMTADEAKTVCRLGQGEACCAFLVCGADGFACARMTGMMSGHIMDRLDAGTMIAKGGGGWAGCAWEGEVPPYQPRSAAGGEEKR
jgi:hypothetical protein